MAIIGFSFTKFDCVKNSGSVQGSIDIKHNVSVVELRKNSLNVGASKSEVLEFDFNFEVDYGSSLGKIFIKGNVIYSDTQQIVSETLSMWQKEKKLPVFVHEQIYSFVYNKAVVKALEFADMLNLPAPIPLPKFSLDKKGD